MISYQYTKIVPLIANVQGFEKVIIQLTVGMTAYSDNKTAYYEETHMLDIDSNGGISNFINFDEMTEDQVNVICDNIAEIGHFKTRLNEMLENKVPIVSKFSWQS